MLTRSSKHILKYSNKEKLNLLSKFFTDYKVALKECVELLSTGKLPVKINLTSKEIPALGCIAHSRWKQVIYKQASEIVRSTEKKNKELRFKKYKRVYSYFKSKERMLSFTSKKYSELNIKYRQLIKPNVENISINIDERLNNLVSTSGEFNEFLRVTLHYFHPNKKRAITVNLPVKQHKQSLKFKEWDRKKSIQLKEINGNYYVSFVYENIEVPNKTEGSSLGIDIGYKKLITTSNNEIIGREDLEEIYNRISKSKRNSNNYKQLLSYRNNYVGQCINKLDLTSVKTLIVEDLKNVKKSTKQDKRMSSKFMNKLQYWLYPKVLSKLEEKCKEQGIELVEVSPAYTSQTCSKCKHIDKNSRKGERYVCTACSFEIDADYNAAINIRNGGVYSPSNIKTQLVGECNICL